MIKTDELRKLYLDFFKAKNHKVFSSDSLLPHEDPSLLFTGAGMNQFKPYFLGLKKDVKRATSCQKCLRTADLDRVGKTATHHSFFEMLGNFSFGDYFKEEAIEWGWEFVTKVLKLPEKKLWVSVYEEDNEAYNIWKNKIGLPESKIVRMGPQDNFWPANAPKDGPNGPCGPCSEIYVGETPGKGVEIWNLVFTQFDRQSDGSLKPLPQKNIDTGMGMERTAAVLQGVENNFDTDNFKAIRSVLWTHLKKGGTQIAHENAVMDHLRAVVFCVGDGVVPSNEGRGYVVRKLIRLACDHLDKAGAVKPGSFHKLIPAVVDVMKGAYPELVERQKDITGSVQNEERSYLEVLKNEIPRLLQESKSLKDIVVNMDSSSADLLIAKLGFKYYDTYGLPFETISATASTVGLSLNKQLFEKQMEMQRKRSREGSKIAGDIFKKEEWHDLVEGLMPTQFLGYETLETTAKLIQKSGDDAVLIFDKTPFYAEAGGQVGDMGCISGPNFEAQVVDTQGLEKCVLHKTKVLSGHPKIGENYKLTVDRCRRADIMKNHTATHLLHSALRKVLGEHVKQSGSLVAPDTLRFDFTHFSAVSVQDLAKVEEMVNAQIQKDTLLQKKVMPKEKAAQEGAIAFFGDKYGDEVRVVSVGDFSKEFCGGTHLERTGEIELFKIISEGSIQAGVRRLEAVTGRAAKERLEEQRHEILELCRIFGAKEESLLSGLKKATDRVQGLKNKLISSAAKKINQSMDEALKKSRQVAGANLVVKKMNGADVELLKIAADRLRSQGQPFAALMISESEGKITFAVAGSEALVKKGFQSGNIVKNIAKLVEGNGGGRPEFAVGGGKNLSKQNEAIEAGTKEIERQLSAYEGH